MKIMIIGSIRNSASSSNALLKIIETLEKSGHNVFHEHITSNTQHDLDSMTSKDNTKFHSNILKRIKSADIVVSECTDQSLSVGYLLSYAAELNKPVLIFYSQGSSKPNLFPTLADTGKFFLINYKEDAQLSDLVLEYVDYAQDQQDVRFNFFISPAIGNYLDWISKEKKIPRSVYLRGLIESNMEDNDEYNS